MPIPEKTLKDGTKIPALGLGTWLMGGDTSRTENAQQDAHDITAIRTAIELGFTHIDTAEAYGDGHTEELIAQAIKESPRTDLFLASKAKQGHHTKPLLHHALNESLKRLNTDYLDLYYLHQPTLETPVEETAEALNLAYKQGKIKHIGVCNFTADRLDNLQRCLEPRIIANQVHYNLSFREPEICGLLDHAKQKDYFIIAWRPLRLKRRNQDNPAVSYNIWEKGISPRMDGMSQKLGLTNTQLALLWTTHHPNVATLIKSSNPTHLQEAIQGFDRTLSRNDYDDLSRNFRPQYTKSDTIPLI